MMATFSLLQLFPIVMTMMDDFRGTDIPTDGPSQRLLHIVVAVVVLQLHVGGR